MNKEEALKKISSIHQEAILEDWDNWNEEQKQNFLHDIESLDLDIFKQQQASLSEQEQATTSFGPFTSYFFSGNRHDKELGKKIVAEGKAACLIVAGGQGTRLNFPHAKGMFPITPRHKTIFQLFAEKTAAAGSQAGVRLPLAIMTSGENDREVRNYFKVFNYFDLEEDQVSFFTQRSLPFLDQSGDLLVQKDGFLAKGPDGNGSSLYHFVESGIWQQWKDRGIEYVNFILVDNPLADPFDAELIGFHARNQNEISIKCVEKSSPEEKVGVLVEREGKISVVEYTELSDEKRNERDSQGRLAYNCANISLFCLSMDFILQTGKEFKTWAILHKALKNVKPLQLQAWKFEYYIFDILLKSGKAQALIYPRSQVFAPLKNAEGENSKSTVQEAIKKRDREVYFESTGEILSDDLAGDLPQSYYYSIISNLN